jgi:hypothetical protein
MTVSRTLVQSHFPEFREGPKGVFQSPWWGEALLLV